MSAASLKGNSAVYVAAAALNATIPFLLLPLLTRWLGPAEFGLVGVFLALVNVATVLVGLSAHGLLSVTYFRHGVEQIPALVGACMRLLCITALPLVAAFVLFARPLQHVTGITVTWGWTIVVTAAAQFVVGIGLAVWQAREQAKRCAAVQVGYSASAAMLTVLLVGAAGWRWEGRVGAQVVAATAFALLTFALLRRDHLLRWRETGGAPLRAALRFGLPLVPHSLAAVVMISADRLALSGLGGPEAVGHYFAAFQIAAVLTVAAAAVNQAWVPWLYRRLASPTPQALRDVVRATYRLYGALLAAATVLSLAAPWLIYRIAGPGFDPAVNVLRWLAPAAALSGMYYFVTGYLFYAGRTGVLSAITVSCAGLQVGLILALVPHFGAEGAAAATLVSAFAYWLAIWWAASLAVPMPWSLRDRNKNS